MTEKPKPCPFCGGLRRSVFSDSCDETDIAWVACDPIWSCGMEGPKRNTAEEAIAAWNRLTVLPEGWVAVPGNPTQAMVDEALASWSITPAQYYRYMVAAAPKPEEN